MPLAKNKKKKKIFSTLFDYRNAWAGKYRVFADVSTGHFRGERESGRQMTENIAYKKNRRSGSCDPEIDKRDIT